jgi:mannose-6-phosphate isomerase-like protein (cupin superfamily)
MYIKMLRTTMFMICICTFGCAKVDESLNAPIKSFGFSEIPDSSFVMPTNEKFDTAYYIIQAKHLKKYYDHPGELGYIAEGSDYDFKSLSVVMAMTLPNGGPPLHTHGMEELHVVYNGTVEYIINEKRFMAIGPYIVKIPAGAPHAFINRGEIPINVVGILPENNTSYQELGPNPLLEK